MLDDAHQLLPGSWVYRTILIGGLVVSFALWLRLARRDRSMIAIYLGGVLGGFTGAKIVYIFAEGWQYLGEPLFWMRIVTGKTIVGALLGGYAGIEIAKSAIGYRKATGDWFALVVPIAIAAGRIGCLTAGCCLGVEVSENAWCAFRDGAGVPRWPAPVIELAFNLLVFSILFPMRRFQVWPGQLFHLYLISYGAFRFAHEFLRATEKPFAGLSGYQIAAVALIVLGVWRYAARRRVKPASLMVD